MIDPSQWELMDIKDVHTNRSFWLDGAVYAKEEGGNVVKAYYSYHEEVKRCIWGFHDGEVQIPPGTKVRLIPEQPDFEIPHEVPMPPE